MMSAISGFCNLKKTTDHKKLRGEYIGLCHIYSLDIKSKILYQSVGPHMDRSIESGKLDALNKRMLKAQLVYIKSSKQLGKQLAVELEVIAPSYYTIAGSFQKDYHPTHLQFTSIRSN